MYVSPDDKTLSRLDDNSTTKKASNMGFSGFVSGFDLVLIHKSNSINFLSKSHSFRVFGCQKCENCNMTFIKRPSGK